MNKKITILFAIKHRTFLLSINMQDSLANRHKNFLLAIRDNILKAL